MPWSLEIVLVPTELNLAGAHSKLWTESLFIGIEISPIWHYSACMEIEWRRFSLSREEGSSTS